MARQPCKAAAEPEEPVDEIAAFIQALQPIRATGEGPYKPVDRYRDFHSVFGSDAGKRVLSQIVDKGDRRVTEMDAEKQATLIWRAAQRELAQWIVAVATVPPRQG